jgi:hypothetical protein
MYRPVDFIHLGLSNKLTPAQKMQAAELFLPRSNPSGIDVVDVSMRLNLPEPRFNKKNNMFETGTPMGIPSLIFDRTGRYSPIYSGTPSYCNCHRHRKRIPLSYYDEAEIISPGEISPAEADYILTDVAGYYRSARRQSFWLRMALLAGVVAFVVAILTKK